MPEPLFPAGDLAHEVAAFDDAVQLVHAPILLVLVPKNNALGRDRDAGEAGYLGSNHAGLRPPKGIAIAEVGGILLCGTFSLIFGILTLVFLNDPEVVEWYEKKRLEG